MTNTTELKKLAEAASLTGAQLVGMSASEFAEAQRLKQQFRQIRPAAILKLLAINAELVEALKKVFPVVQHEKFIVDSSYGKNFSQERADKIRAAHEAARAALAKAEGGEL